MCVSVYRMGLVFLCLLGLIGCRDAKSPPVENPPKTAQEETAVKPTLLQDGVPGTPEAAMRQMVEGLRRIARW